MPRPSALLLTVLLLALPLSGKAFEINPPEDEAAAAEVDIDAWNARIDRLMTSLETVPASGAEMLRRKRDGARRADPIALPTPPESAPPTEAVMSEPQTDKRETVPASGQAFLDRLREQVGVASFYSYEFSGRKTASGHVFDPHGPTAAHKTLPLGTEVRITNLRNGKAVTATINDRGPYIPGRILDVSYGLAKQLDFVRSGMTQVKVEVLNWGPIRRLRASLAKN